MCNLPGKLTVVAKLTELWSPQTTQSSSDTDLHSPLHCRPPTFVADIMWISLQRQCTVINSLIWIRPEAVSRGIGVSNKEVNYSISTLAGFIWFYFLVLQALPCNQHLLWLFGLQDHVEPTLFFPFWPRSADNCLGF